MDMILVHPLFLPSFCLFFIIFPAFLIFQMGCLAELIAIRWTHTQAKS